LRDGQQVAMAWSHDEAWQHALTLAHPGCVVRCEPTEVPIAAEADSEAQPSLADFAPGA